MNLEADALKTRISKIQWDKLDLEDSEDPESPRLKPTAIAESKYLYDAKAIDEWKRNCLASNAAEAAHDSDFISTLRSRMKKSADAARNLEF